MITTLRLLLICCIPFCAAAQDADRKQVLFIGNSYTAANNLPQMVQQMAESTGDVLFYDAHTPGGARFMQHASNPTVLNKLEAEAWDYVVLQAQS